MGNSKNKKKPEISLLQFVQPDSAEQQLFGTSRQAVSNYVGNEDEQKKISQAETLFKDNALKRQAEADKIKEEDAAKSAQSVGTGSVAKAVKDQSLFALPLAAGVVGAVTAKKAADGLANAANSVAQKGEQWIDEKEKDVNDSAALIFEYLQSPESDATLDGEALLEAVILWARESRKSGAEKKNNPDSFAKQETLRPGETVDEFAKRVCDTYLGEGKYRTGPGSAYSRTRKYAQEKLKQKNRLDNP